MDIRFGRPAPGADWTTLQNEITALAQADLGYKIEWEEINTRRWGSQRLPTRVWFEQEADYFHLLGKTEEVRRLRVNLELTRHHCPELEGWLASHVMRLVEDAHHWSDVLQVCRYFIAHPRPRRYARELPIAVSTKFIEEHRPLFRSLFDHLLPGDTIDASTDHFETRYGLNFDEPLIRLRLLCDQLAETLRMPVRDLSVPVSQARVLPWTKHTVVIVENKMTFLSLPALAGTLAIWGGGNAAALLVSFPWLANCRLFYWGDLDVHGFHILARLRGTFPHLQNVLMNETVLDRFPAYQVSANIASYENTSGLTPAEQATYLRLKEKTLLLEQEKISHAYAVEMLRAQIESSPESI
jgi:hypothetical protein